MFDIFLDKFRHILKSRLFPISLIYTVLFLVLVITMFKLQIIKSEEYEKQGGSPLQKIREIKSTRGNIYDANGNVLATNQLSYSVTLEDTGDITDNQVKNTMIYNLIKLIETNGNQLDTEFYMKYNKKGELIYSIDGNQIDRFKRDVYSLKSVDELTPEQKAATAQNVFDYLNNDSKNSHKFQINTSLYSKEDVLKIMSVRFTLLMNSYIKYIPITISSGVNEQTISAVRESSGDMPGVEVVEEQHRVYNDSKYFSHILGYTGLITAENLEDLKTQNKNTQYSATDQIGKTGIEKLYEDTLKGTKGSETLLLNNNSRVEQIKDPVSPVAGNDVYLSIESDLQKACYDILEKKLAGILLSKINNSMNAGTKGESASDIKVPIYDVYNALIKNSIVKTSHFTDKNATSLEKSVYNKFENKQKEVQSSIQSVLAFDSTKTKSDISEEMQEYLDYIYKLLTDKGLIKTNDLNKDNENYKNFINGKLSMSKFLQYAISTNCINLEMLNVGTQYFSTEEIYEKILAYTFDLLNDDNEFNKLIYKSLIYNFQLSGTDVCLLLYDQGVLKADDTENKLKSGAISSYTFIKEKIKSLEITPGQLGLEPCSGSIVVTDIKTGKVKALVSYPSYDNNMFANTINQDYYNDIVSNSASPLLCRPTQQKTAPGSTFKLVTSSASLQEGIINPSSTVKDEVTFKKIGLPYPHCWDKSGHGTINVSQAIQHSCNFFFYEMGFRLSTNSSGNYDSEKGLSKLKKYAKLFGLDNLSGIEMPEAAPSFSDYDAVRSAIGQGTSSFTPVQLSRYVTTVANEGTCFNLSLVKSVVNKTDNSKSEVKSSTLQKLDFSQITWNTVKEGMKKVVNDGTIAPLFEKLKVQVAGKTGTAQESKLKPNHALFVSYAPFDNPEISVTTVIPNGYTSSNAAELARDVYEYYFEPDKRTDIVNQKVNAPELDSKAFSD